MNHSSFAIAFHAPATGRQSALLVLDNLICRPLHALKEMANYPPDPIRVCRMFYYSNFVALKFAAALIAFLLEPKETSVCSYGCSGSDSFIGS